MEQIKTPVGRVLVSGATGLTGRALTPLLKESGYELAVLYRKEKPQTGDNCYRWDPSSGYIEPGALNGITHIIHLAGEGIADRRWSTRRKREIVDSRVQGARLIFDHTMREGKGVRCFISASGAGYYGSITGKKIYTEEDPPGSDFLATTCVKWEEAADMFRHSGIRTVKLRTGVVLSGKGGFVGKITAPMKAGVAAWFGDGMQYLPWIHINDLCRIYLKALDDDSMEGPFNAVAPVSVTQKELVSILRKRRRQPAIPIGIPAFAARLAFGEMSSVLLCGSRVSASALEAAGFRFRHPSPAEAIEAL
ncbi:MAG: TIGR01777 family protein [Bacteroidetes bacterium]|nr:TIGR01777 family protein [Bacteroidota bacterium]